MTKKFIVILILLSILAGVVVWQEIFVSNTISNMQNKIIVLQTTIEEENLPQAQSQAQDILNYWNNAEVTIALFVDYRDIEQIGRQADYVLAHLQNADFELAKVECELFSHLLNTFYNMVKFDWQNIM